MQKVMYQGRRDPYRRVTYEIVNVTLLWMYFARGHIQIDVFVPEQESILSDVTFGLQSILHTYPENPSKSIVQSL